MAPKVDKNVVKTNLLAFREERKRLVQQLRTIDKQIRSSEAILRGEEKKESIEGADTNGDVNELKEQLEQTKKSLEALERAQAGGGAGVASVLSDTRNFEQYRPYAFL